MLRRRRGDAGGGVTAGARPGPRGRRRRPPGVGAAAPGAGAGSVAWSRPSHNSLYGTLTPPRPPPAPDLDQ